jgi:hypothetical protein
MQLQHQPGWRQTSCAQTGQSGTILVRCRLSAASHRGDRRGDRHGGAHVSTSRQLSRAVRLSQADGRSKVSESPDPRLGELFKLSFSPRAGAKFVLLATIEPAVMDGRLQSSREILLRRAGQMWRFCSQSISGDCRCYQPAPVSGDHS